jgi:anti-anti-sigma factor
MASGVSEPAEQFFDVEMEQRDGVVIVRPEGPLTGVTVEVLGEILGDLAEQSASAVLDLSKVARIDDAGVQLVLRAHATSMRDGFGLTLLPGPPVVMRVFELAGVLPQLPFPAR